MWAGDEPFADEADEPDEPPLAEERDLAAPLAHEGHRPADGVVRGGVEGRRTVKIGGRPAEFHSAPRRPSRAVHERVGPAARSHRRLGLRPRAAADHHRDRDREHLSTDARRAGSNVNCGWVGSGEAGEAVSVIESCPGVDSDPYPGRPV